MRTFTLTIRRVRDAYRVIAETSESGLAAATRVDEPFVLDITSLPKSRTAGMSHDAVLGYGTTLGNATFVGKVGEAMQRAQSRADQAGEALHVLLAIEDADLVALRWERLCGRLDGGWQFLRLQQRTPFSFSLPSENDKHYPAISRTDLRALVVVANLGSTRPYGLADFDASETVKSIRGALGDVPCTVLANDGVDQVESADGLPTLDEICECITKERYSILHVVCHGQFKGAEYEANELKSPAETYLFLRKSGQIDPSRPDDHVHRVSATEFVHRLRMLQGARGLPHLTFLCSCDTASPEAEQGLGGLGQRLVRELGMPAVIAMTEPVAISLSERLSAKFYERLHEHGSVDQALSEASASVTGHGYVLVPELFSRLAGRKLFDEIGPLTTGQWEYGLRQVLELVVDRAPVLKGQVDDLSDRARLALEIRKRTEHLPDQSDEMRRAEDVLRSAQATLNELCQDFLEDSFDHVAKGLPLAVSEYDGRCPFPGLGAFDAVRDEQGKIQEDFRPFFFGREKLTEEILRLHEAHRFVAVLGGSGSGKSSLVRAGLLTELRKERPDLRAIVFPPGRDPLARLETELTNTSQPDIIVVDQFEELFTLCPDIEQRKSFLETLLPLRKQCAVVITMRADFLGECVDHDELYQLLDADEKHLKILQPLKGNDLRNAMEAQSNAVKLQFEPGLAARIFEDIENEPGAMPLLQHCLRQLWQFRHGRWLKWSRYEYDERKFNATRGYQHVGGVTRAISRTAEDVYRNLSQEERGLLPFIFERLTRIDADTTELEQRRDTRRREDLGQLTWKGGDPYLTKSVVTRLADAKLVTTTQRNISLNKDEEVSVTEVEVSHEALIQHWKRLQGWLNDARDTARLVDRIRRDAVLHNSTDPPSQDNLTLRGAVLGDASALLGIRPPRLSEDEAEFVVACLAKQKQEEQDRVKDAEEKARLANEASQAEKGRRKIAQILTTISVSLLVVSIIVSIMLGKQSEKNRKLAQKNEGLLKDANQSLREWDSMYAIPRCEIYCEVRTSGDGHVSVRLEGNRAPHVPTPEKPSLSLTECINLMEEIPRLRDLIIVKVPLDHSHFRQIAKLNQLTTLHISEVDATDETIALIRPLSQLRSLLLNDQRLTGGCLKTISNFRQLEYLYASDMNLPQGSLRPLVNMQALSTLDLAGTNVTGADIAQLHELRSLRKLILGRTSVAESVIISLLCRNKKLSVHKPDTTWLLGSEVTDSYMINTWPRLTPNCRDIEFPRGSSLPAPAP